METIKDYVIGVFMKDEVPEYLIKDVLKMSEERIQWIKDVAWNLARITEKYNRFAITKELSVVETMILYLFETEETKKWNAEMKIIYEEERRKHKEFLRKIRQKNIEKSSSSMIYLFPIGEA